VDIANLHLKGQPLTADILDELVTKCETGWDESEVTVQPTNYSKAIDALQALDIPFEEIKALERQAQNERISFFLYVRSIVQNALSAHQ